MKTNLLSAVFAAALLMVVGYRRNLPSFPSRESSRPTAELVAGASRKGLATLAPIEMAGRRNGVDNVVEGARDLVVEELSEAEYEKALNTLVNDPSASASDLRQLLIRRWAELDPAAAARWASTLGSGNDLRLALKQVAIAWSNRDLNAAAQWVQGLPAGPEKSAAILDVGYEAARTSPVSAVALAAALEPSAERKELLVHAVSQWAAETPEEAVQWAEGIPNLALRQELLSSVAISMAEQNGAGAADLVARFLEPGADQDRAAVAVVQRWAYENPSEAAAWVAQFPDTDTQLRAVESLLSVWVDQDTQAASEWLASLPSGSIRAASEAAYQKALVETARRVSLASEPVEIEEGGE